MPDAPDLTDAERAAVLALLKRAIAESRYPLSPEVRALRRALDKLEPRRHGRNRIRRLNRPASPASFIVSCAALAGGGVSSAEETL